MALAAAAGTVLPEYVGAPFHCRYARCRRGALQAFESDGSPLECLRTC